MKSVLCFLLCAFYSLQIFAQLSLDSIHTDFVLNQRRVQFNTYMREQTIKKAFSQPLDSNTEYDYESACWAISQFMLRSTEIKNGLEKMLSNYDSLQYSSKRALLEAVYGVYSTEFGEPIKKILMKETEPKLFAMEALYFFNGDNSKTNTQFLLKQMQNNFQQEDTLSLLVELKKFLPDHKKFIQKQTPLLYELFAYQKISGQKIVYSFQRWNRDYPGLAIIQKADGNFMRDSSGKLLMFQQLARSASNLPYFITNGNTPQGIYRITGVQITHNNFIGPTPTLQLVMPFENDSAYWHVQYDSAKNVLNNYLNLLPNVWRKYQPITEAFYAGKVGRTEIIAHGTTLDPAYFIGKTFYPFTPTLGCLCAKETWNIYNGRLIESEQFNLINSFLSTEKDTGYLFVINLNNEQKPVSKTEIEQLVNSFERINKK